MVFHLQRGPGTPKVQGLKIVNTSLQAVNIWRQKAMVGIWAYIVNICTQTTKKGFANPLNLTLLAVGGWTGGGVFAIVP